MILVSSFSYFTLAVHMREASRVRYTPRAWDPPFLLSMLNGLLYLGLCSD